MNFTNLKYFLLLAKELNFTKAAKKLYISQQSLSAHIAKLENHLNIKLFDRNNPITLTPAGKCLYIRATEIFELKDSLELEIENIRNNIVDEITVGATISRGPLLLPSIIKKFQQEYPLTKINIIQENSSKKLEIALYKGLVDIILGFTPNDPNTINTSFFCKEEFILAIPDEIMNNFFPTNKEEILELLNNNLDFSIIKECPFIKMDSSTYAGKIFDDIFLTNKIKPNIYLNITNIETMLALCYAGLGIAIVPKIFILSALKNENSNTNKKIHYFPIQLPEDSLTISLSYLKNKKLSFSGLEFIRIAKEVAKQYKM